LSLGEVIRNAEQQLADEFEVFRLVEVECLVSETNSPASPFDIAALRAQGNRIKYVMM